MPKISEVDVKGGEGGFGVLLKEEFSGKSNKALLFITMLKVGA
jgi:hypothetical protein